jgi:MFS transporter, DHA1 family, inner membrane transport protein
MKLSKKKERIILLTLAAIQFTNIVDFMIMMPMGDLLKRDLHINPAGFGWLVSAYGLAAGVTAFIGVFYLDSLDRKRALLVAYLGFILGTLSSAVVPTTSNLELNYTLFIGTRVFTGITGGLLGGLVMSIVADVFPMERRGRAMATITLAFSFASVVGVPISLMLVDLFGGNWHVPFYLVAGLAVPFWILTWIYLPRLRDHLDSNKKFEPLETITYTIKNPAQRSALLFTILLVLGQFTIISMLAPFMISNVRLEQEEVKYMYLVGGLCTVVSSILIGKAVDRWGRFKIFQFFALVSIIPIFVNTHLEEMPLGLVLLLSGIFFIFVTGRMIPANTIVSGVVNPKYRAGFMSLNSAAQSLSSGASAALAGMIVVQTDVDKPMLNYDVVGYVAIAFTILAILVMIRLKKIST